MIRIFWIGSLFVGLGFFACESAQIGQFEVCYSNNALTFNDACTISDKLYFASGDTWTSGYIHKIDESQCDSNQLLSVNALLSIDNFEEDIYAVGMNNNIWVYQDSLWTENIIDSNLVMRDIEVLNDKIILAGGLAYFVGYIQVLDKSGFIVESSFKFDNQINAVQCNSSMCLAIGYGVIYYSIDQGMSWERSDIGGDHFLGLDEDGSGNFYILGSSGKILSTTDGMAFEELDNGSSIAGGWRDIIYNQELGLVIVGDNGKVEMYSFDDKKWSDSYVDELYDVLCVSVLDNTIFLGTRQGEILKIEF